MGVLKRQVAAQYAKNADHKFAILQKEWESIGQDVIVCLIASMSNRIKAVKASDGGSTKC